MSDPKLTVLPLIPKGVEGKSWRTLDSTPVLQETLRDFLEEDITRCRMKEREKIVKEYIPALQQIGEVENQMLAVQAVNARTLERYDDKELKLQCPTLPKSINLVNLPKVGRAKYNLLTTAEIQETICNELGDPSRWALKDFPSFSKNELLGTYERKKQLEPCSEGFKKRAKAKKYKANPVFEFSPKEIHFTEHQIGGRYIKKLNIMNRSARSVKFYVTLSDSSKVFDVQYENMDAMVMLASGQYVSVRILFRCLDLDDYYNSIQIETVREGVAVSNERIYIPVTAIRLPPALITEELLAKKSLNKSVRISQSFTLDCGTRLIGSTYNIKTSLYNIGSCGTFFISSEYTWEFTNVQDMNQNNEIILNAYEVFPAFFCLRQFEKIAVSVTYKPMCEGLHVEKLFIVCDNLTLRVIDMIGEAVLFAPNDFCIKASPKDFDIDESDLYEASMYINFGTVYPGGSSDGHCKIFSESLVDIEFGWNIIPLSSETGVNTIESKNITISPCQGILCCDNSPLIVYFQVCMNNCKPGLYKSGLTLMAYNIPKISVVNKTVLTFPNDSNPMLWTNVEICYLELSVTVKNPYIVIDPIHVDYTDYIYKTNFYYLTVTNNSAYPVNVSWYVPQSNSVIMHITPKEAELEIHAITQFTLEITGIESSPIEEVLQCFVAQGKKTFKCVVHGNVLTKSVNCPYLAYSYGGVQNETVKSFPIWLKAENTNLSSMVDGTEITSVLTKEEDLIFLESFKNNIESLPSPIDEKGQQFKYNMNTEEKGLKSSIIEWRYGDFPVYTDIFYFVQSVYVELTPLHYIMPSSVYVYVPHEITVQLRNYSFLEASYTWGAMIGDDLKNVSLMADKWSGKISGHSVENIQFKLRFETAGTVHFQVPCTIKFMKKALVLKVTGEIKSLNVEYSWMSKEEKVIIPWPYIPTKHDVSKDTGPTDPSCCVCMTGANFNNMKVPYDPKDIAEENTLKYVDSTTSSVPYLNWPLIGGRYYYDSFKKMELLVDFKFPWTFEDFLARITDFPTTDEKQLILNTFSSKAIVIHLKTFEVKTAVISISNLTPIKAEYYSEVKEFYERQPLKHEYTIIEGVKHISKDSIEKVLKNSHILKKNPVKEMLLDKIQNKAGLVLGLSNSKGRLGGYSQVDVELTAFSNCWGIYLDHIKVDITDLDPIHIPVLINSSGKPAWFMFAPYCDEPLLRFGALSPFEKKELTVMVYNNSFLHLKIAWSAYTEIPLSEFESNFCLPDEPGPFSLNIEFHPSKEESFCRVNLIDYLGEIDRTYYKCSPYVTYLKPKSKAPLKITVNTTSCWFDINNLEKVLRGGICGVIYIDCEKETDDLGFSCYRPDGFEIDTLLLRLEAKVTMPLLQFVNPDKDSFMFFIPSYKIAREQKSYTRIKKYLLQNTGSNTCLCNFSITGLMTMKQLRLYSEKDGFEEIYTDLSPTIFIRSGYFVELSLLLEITKRQMYTYMDRGKLDSNVAISKSSRKNKSVQDNLVDTCIVIKQGNNIEQCIPMTIEVGVPEITVSTKAMYFGRTYLNQTKTDSFRIKSSLGDEAFIIKIVTEYAGIFAVTPFSGTVKQGRFVHIDVQFTPKECLKYKAKAVVLTNYQMFVFEVQLEGTGTWDYHYGMLAKC